MRLRARRLVRRIFRGTEQAGRTAGEQFDKNVLGRFGRIRHVWRRVTVWIVLMALIATGILVQLNNLKQYYQVLTPTPGGIYSEGIVGSFTTANPLYAVSDVDTSVSRLVFGSLLTFDQMNHLTGDLADRWTVNTAGTVYTIHLRPNLTWQDGQPLTADDVVFTYHTIQNPDAQSPLQTSWQGVQVAAIDSRTITFTLPNPLSSFPYSLTNGIVPKHILASYAAGDLRSASFNTAAPVGAGPFAWSSIGVTGTDKTAEEQIILKPFQGYWAGKPALASFDVDAFADNNTIITAYKNEEITAMAGLDSVPTGIASPASHIYNLPLTAGTYVFFKTTDGPILNDAKVRQALVLASSPASVMSRLGYPVIAVNEPLLMGQLAYNATYAQVTGQLAKAQQMLSDDGWTPGADGIRVKNGQRLSFNLVATDTPEYTTVATELRRQWRLLGVDVQLQLQSSDAFQLTLSQQNYDALLYGISIGADPDVFAYWDSSQGDVLSASRLNFSDYSSGTADAALEAGRTRLDDNLRAIKYKPFLQTWQTDAPALGLYQPRFLYISHVQVYGLRNGQINTDADRFTNVQNWMIHLSWVTR